MRDFLLRTSILQRFNASLCDVLLDDGDAAAFVGGEALPNSRAIINYLEKNSLFVVPLDDEAGWYRYYHPFGEALHDELDRTSPTLGVELHRRAARWYAVHGLATEAIEHALLAQDWAQAADLLADAGHELLVNGEFIVLNRWLDALPPEEIARRPRLAIVNGWLQLFRGPLQDVQATIEQLVVELQSPAADADPARCPAPGEVAALRTMLASYRWEVRATLALGAQAEGILSPDDAFSLAAVTHAMGRAWLLNGRCAEAAAYYMRALGYATVLGSAYMVLFPTFRLAETYLEQGALTDAAILYRRGLQQAADHDGAGWPVTADGCMGLADLLRERNDLLGAEHYIRRVMVLAPLRSVEVWAVASTINARIRLALGRRDEAATPLADALHAVQGYNRVHARVVSEFGRSLTTRNFSSGTN